MTKVNVTRFGTGPDRALMLHCTLAHGGAWKSVASEFREQLTCFAPDMPGHGRSEAWDETQDIHDAVTRNARRYLETPSHVVGHSFGATVALRLAIQTPDLVRSLTLIEPVLFAAARNTSALEVYEASIQDYSRARDAQDWPAMARAFNAAWGGGSDWDDLPEGVRKSQLAQMPMVAASEAAIAHDVHKMLADGTLEQLNMPITFLRGGLTQPVIAEIQQNLMRRLPQAREIVVPEAGHMLPITHPDPVRKALAAHLQALKDAA